MLWRSPAPLMNNDGDITGPGCRPRTGEGCNGVGANDDAPRRVAVFRAGRMATGATGFDRLSAQRSAVPQVGVFNEAPALTLAPRRQAPLHIAAQM